MPRTKKQKAIKEIMAYQNVSFAVASKIFNVKKMKTSTSNLNESIQSIQNNSRNSEINSLEVIQAANFPPLNNSFSNLSETMEVVNSYRYSMDDLRRTYSDAMASPSPTRKKI